MYTFCKKCELYVNSSLFTFLYFLFWFFHSWYRISFKTSIEFNFVYWYSCCKLSNNFLISLAYFSTSTSSFYVANTGYFLLQAFVQSTFSWFSALVCFIIFSISSIFLFTFYIYLFKLQFYILLIKLKHLGYHLVLLFYLIFLIYLRFLNFFLCHHHQ